MGEVVWGSGQPRPTDPPTHPHQKKNSSGKKWNLSLGRKFEADFRSTNFVLASDPPTQPGGGGGVGTRPRGGGGWHKASVSDCLPLAAPIGLSPLLILTLCGPERVLVVSTEPPDDLSCLTTPGVGRPGDGAVARAGDQGHPDAPSESVQGFAD